VDPDARLLFEFLFLTHSATRMLDLVQSSTCIHTDNGDNINGINVSVFESGVIQRAIQDCNSAKPSTIL